MALSWQGGIPVIADFLALSAQSAELSSNSQYSCRYRPELSLILKDISMTIVCSENMAILFLC
jgi:hypothetical protein